MDRALYITILKQEQLEHEQAELRLRKGKRSPYLEHDGILPRILKCAGRSRGRNAGRTTWKTKA